MRMLAMPGVIDNVLLAHLRKLSRDARSFHIESMQRVRAFVRDDEIAIARADELPLCDWTSGSWIEHEGLRIAFEPDGSPALVTYRGRALRFTPTKMKVVAVLAAARGECVSTPRLLTRVWGQSADGSDTKVRTTIREIAQMLGSETDLAVQNRRGVGYVLEKKPQPELHKCAAFSVGVVDDDPALGRAFTRFLAAVAPVLVCGTLAEGRELLHQQRLAALFLDLVLPDGDGTSLIEHAQSKDVPVMVVSRYLNAQREKSLKAAGVAMRSKPVDLKDIVSFAEAGLQTARMRERRASRVGVGS